MKKNIAKKAATDEHPLAGFADLLAAARNAPAYYVEGAILEFTEEIISRQQEAGLSNSQLARKLDASPAYVTKLLGGENNFTVETMVKVARALDCRLRVCLEPAGMETEWMHFHKVKPPAVPATAPAMVRWDDAAFRRIPRPEQFFPSATLPHEKLAATA